MIKTEVFTFTYQYTDKYKARLEEVLNREGIEIFHHLTSITSTGGTFSAVIVYKERDTINIPVSSDKPKINGKK